MNNPKIIAAAAMLACGALAVAGDWPMWGGTVNRNMVSPEKNILSEFSPGQYKKGTDLIDPATTRNVRWVVKMGSQTYGNPTVANGRVYVGTNNEGNTDPRFPGDHSLLKCLDEKTGRLVWQLTVPKLGSGKVSDWEYLGICSSPAIDGDKVYVVTNRCEVVCLDANGLSNGNDGFKDEGKYMAGIDSGKSVDVSATDADILWRYDMRDELGVFPHNVCASSPLVVGDRVYASTSNGVDWSHTNIPNPKAPSLITLDRYTGELKGEEASGLSQRILHGNWTSPSFGQAGDKTFLVYGGPDGVLYAFDPVPARDEKEDLNFLKELWRYDGNLKTYRFKDGDEKKPIKYALPEGPSEFIATPAVHKGRVYAAIGQDPEHGEGVGNLSCVDLATGRKIWNYDKINRSISTCAITEDGLLFMADFSGFVYCFDAGTGKLHWQHDTMSHIWGSTLVVDGKVYVGNEDGDLFIFAASKDKKQIGQAINFNDPIYSTPVVANGTIYIATATQLFAIGK